MKRPFSTISTGKPLPAEGSVEDELERDEQETAAAREKIKAKQASLKDKVQDLLDVGWSQARKGWDWFVDADGLHMIVGQFFDKEMNPNLECSIAVDKFYNTYSYLKINVAQRRALLNAHGIKYGVLHPGNNLTDLLLQLESQKI